MYTNRRPRPPSTEAVAALSPSIKFRRGRSLQPNAGFRVDLRETGLRPGPLGCRWRQPLGQLEDVGDMPGQVPGEDGLVMGDAVP